MTAAQDHPLTKDGLAARVAADIAAGSYVNLGIGLPTLVADHLPADRDITLHTENGMLGMGRAARGDEIDPELINAGKIPVLETPGAAYFHQADSFAMMRGGYLDLCVLGGMEVSVTGDLANWSTGSPGAVPAVGGAMDLAVGAKRTVVMMTLFAKDGSPKLVPRCALPLTGVGCVARVYTDLAVIDVGVSGAVVLETFGITATELEQRLGFRMNRRNG